MMITMMINLAPHQPSRKSLRPSKHHLPLLNLSKYIIISEYQINLCIYLKISAQQICSEYFRCQISTKPEQTCNIFKISFTGSPCLSSGRHSSSSSSQSACTLLVSCPGIVDVIVIIIIIMVILYSFGLFSITLSKIFLMLLMKLILLIKLVFPFLFFLSFKMKNFSLKHLKSSHTDQTCTNSFQTARALRARFRSLKYYIHFQPIPKQTI